jgi:thioredoxin reductase (NADPH)
LIGGNILEKHDLIIVGAGPAGLTASIYAGRAGLNTLLIDKGICGGLGLEVPSMENFPGFEMISGLTLIKKMKKQAERHCKIYENQEVLNITKVENGFEVESIKDKYFSKAIILAMGTKHRKLDVPGENEFIGRGVSYCATCDGPLFAQKEIIIVGGGNSAIQEGIFLSNIGAKVTIIHRRGQLRGENYLQQRIKDVGMKTILNSEIVEIKGENFVESVIIKNDKGELNEIKTDGVFISIGLIPINDLAIGLNLKLDEEKHISTDKQQRTNIPFVYSAGDITNGLKQWVVACSEGAIASTSAYSDLENLK